MTSPHTSVISRSLIVLGCSLLSTQLATAQVTNLSGNVSGTLTGGVYHAVSSLTIPAGQTLTLQPGVIIKFVGTQQFVVHGTLLSNGTAANPVIFTDDADDSAGGDTNNNGPSSGSPGAWYNMTFQGSTSSRVLTHTEIRYAGYAGYIAVDLNQADITLDACTVRDTNTGAINL
ncbi:MAG: hypothetical protein KDC98_11340, partial [Planctomycetes bacterium]|nr:hypothetical protein [Planctomycetota bacterium]